MKLFASHSLEETRNFAAEWLKTIAPVHDVRKEATLVGLSGHLGAGKTAFVKAVAAELGISEEVTSPTFVIMKIYDISRSSWKRLVHIDAYRLEKREELEALGWESLASDPGNLILVEWPENAGLTLFPRLGCLKFEVQDGRYVISVS